MSTATKRTRRARPATKVEQREVSIERILAAALRLFVSKGYRSATVDDIARACELTKGAVYFYFPSKAAILMALLDEIEHLMVNKMVERITAVGPLIQDKLVAFLHSGAGMGNNKPELILLFILMRLEFNGAGDEIEARVKSIYQKICVSVEELVQRGKAAGEFRTDLETNEIAAILLAVYNGTFMEWYCRPNYLSGRELVRAARESVLKGVLRQAPSAG